MRSLLLLCAAVVLAAGPAPARAEENAFSEAEKAQGWKLLFDGKTLDQWVPMGKKEAWVIEDGALLCTGEGGFLLRSKEEYANFVLSVEFKITKGANSGIFVHLSDLKDWMHRSIEIQVLDSQGKNPSRFECASVYEYQAPSANACRPAGEWNSAVITCKENLITVEHNGRKVNEVDRDRWTMAHQNPDGSPNKFNHALKELPRKGYLALQDHGYRVWFRNLKIKPLP